MSAPTITQNDAPQTTNQTAHDCNCGGEPHGKACTAVLTGEIEYKIPLEMSTPTTIGELRARFIL